MKNLKHYPALGEIFKYPGSDYTKKVEYCQAFLDEYYPEAGKQLQAFTDYILKCTVDEREELFTKTFDVQPICYLDLGYVIFGEDYKRGAFLLHMQEEQLKTKNDCGTDLSDNICNIFTLLPKTNDEAFINELALLILIPGVEKMIAEFASARVNLKLQVLKKMHRAIIQEELNQGNLYRNAFEAVLTVLKSDFNDVRLAAAENKILDTAHHQSFFAKNSVNNEVNRIVNETEVNQIVNNYKID